MPCMDGMQLYGIMMTNNTTYLEYCLENLMTEWEKSTKLMKAMFDIEPMGLYNYDMLPTLQKMQLLYCQIAAHMEAIRREKGEI